jgi:hypothetical protein
MKIMTTMVQVMKERKSWDVLGFFWFFFLCVVANVLVME